MAEEKKGFLLYADYIHTINKMPDDKAGILFKHILKYVNDENPTTDDLIVELTFEPIKQQLKRDLKAWESTKGKYSKAGKASAEARRFEKEKLEQLSTISNDVATKSNDVEILSKMSTVNDNVTVNVTVNDNVTVIKNNIDDRKLKFSDTLKPYLAKYGAPMLNDFFRYWTEPNKSNTKFRQEMEKTWDLARRLDTWSRNNFDKKQFSAENPVDLKRTIKKID